MKRGEEDVHLAESSRAHLSAMLPIVMQLQATVTTLRGEAMANETKVIALESTMVTMAKYEY